MVAQSSATTGAAAAPCGAGRLRAALEFALAGDLRFLAHHDELRLLTRALVRAGWPLAYSQGFNPRPRLVLPLPRGNWRSSSCPRCARRPRCSPA